MEPKDHDVLVTIATQVERLISDVKDVRADIADVKSDLANRVATLESEKLSRADFTAAQNEHIAMHKAFDDRLSFVERAVWIGIGGITILEVVFKFFIK
jgi:hypothetical protein